MPKEIEITNGTVKETPGPETTEPIVTQGVHNYSTEQSYVAPTDPILLRQLEEFQDQKLALMMHWGIYSQIGLVESWALSDEDAHWSRTGVDWDVDGETFKQQYFDLNKSFNPIRFQPYEWADFAKDNGFRYTIFTTKHHDGFCMWDTQYTDYKITAPDCPFHTNPNADIVRVLFDAFRSRGLGVTAYFSKADWHVPTFWSSDYAQGRFTARGPSYDPKEYPQVWEEFVEFTHNQIRELCTQYGKIDALWFDAGWVEEATGTDIRLGEIIEEIRKFQPWLLSVDRTVGGPYENYVTPEQTVPEQPLLIPWESCITIGEGFSYRFENTYKTPRELVNLLIDIVAKGGNLALNIAPQPDGRLPAGAMESARGLGDWLKIYGEAIYGTRVAAPYKKDDVAFTQKDGTVYAFRMYPVAPDTIERTVRIPYLEEISEISLVDTGQTLEHTRDNEGYLVSLPEGYPKATPLALVFALRQ